MKKIVIVCLSILIGVSFSSFLGLFGSAPSPKRKMAYKISNDLSKNLKKKYGLNFMGISEEAVDGKYKVIGFELNFNRTLSKDEGRKLLVECSQDVLQALNSFPNFKQFMINYPFTGNNIIVNIYIQPPKNWDIYYPEIGVFSFYSNTLHYVYFSADNQFTFHLEEKEDYEEAKSIISLQQSNSQLQEQRVQ